MLQNPCKTLGYKKNVVNKNPPGGGKPYPASGLLPFKTHNTFACRHKPPTSLYGFIYVSKTERQLLFLPIINLELIIK